MSQVKNNSKKENQGRDKRKGFRIAELWENSSWWTIWLGFIIIVGAVLNFLGQPVLPQEWGGVEAQSFFSALSPSILVGILITGLISLVLFAISVYNSDRENLNGFLKGFLVIFLLAVVAYILGSYAPLSHYGFNDVIWALIIGLLLSNLFELPAFIKKAARTGLYIKTGLVLLGGSILFNRMLTLGAVGLGVAWLVTPTVLIVMYIFSQKVLKMKDNKELAITISTATSVCGVSAAIASGTASRAKKEEITLAISITLIFTVIMMVAMPALVQFLGLDTIIGSVWLGGTIDATGAVVAASSLLGDEAMEVASIIKMIQNILIGIVAFGIAVFWVSRYDREGENDRQISGKQIITRIPRFIFGFIAASLVFSFLLPESVVQSSLPVLDGYRGFFFTLAFISIGLDTNFKEMSATLKNSRAVKLYLTGQLLNIVLTLVAAYIFFSGHFFELPF